MVPTDVTFLIVLISAAFIGICIAGFITFSKFLKIEKERGRRFRDVHGKQGAPNKSPKA